MDSGSIPISRDLVDGRRPARRAVVYAAYAEAMADPAFVADMDAVTASFDPAVGDGLDDGD